MGERLQTLFFLTCLMVLSTMVDISAAFADSAVGKVTYIDGKVQVLRSDTPQPLALDAPLFSSDVVITDDSGRVKISMIEGSVVFVGRKSRLSIDEYVVEKGELTSGTFNMLWGKVRFAVTKLRAPGASFNVNTSTATLGVRGTVLTVTVPKPKKLPVNVPKTYKPPKLPTTVLLLQGVVVVKSVNGMQKVMKPGTVAEIDKSGLISVRKAKPAEMPPGAINMPDAPGAMPLKPAMPAGSIAPPSSFVPPPGGFVPPTDSFVPPTTNATPGVNNIY